MQRGANATPSPCHHKRAPRSLEGAHAAACPMLGPERAAIVVQDVFDGLSVIEADAVGSQFQSSQRHAPVESVEPKKTNPQT